MRSRLLNIFLILLLALLLELRIPYGSGTSFDFLFVALIVSSFFLSFWELVFCVVLGVFVTNWRPSPSFEMVTFALVPFVSFSLRKILPWHSWLNATVLIIVGTIVFYAASDSAFFLRSQDLFLGILFGGLCFGMVVFHTLNRFYAVEA